MRTSACLTAIAILVVCSHAAGGSTFVRFDKDKPERPPAGWTVAITGEGTPQWWVERDDSAPSPPHVLKQSAATPRPSFPLCLRHKPSLKNGFVEVKFKTVGGKIDQAAGLVWRAKDKNNYYVCRANALENNIVLYKVENGKRKALDIVGRQGGYGVQNKVTAGQWHRLRVEFVMSVFRVFFEGKELFTVKDSTFTHAGMVGLWTKADSLTLFDDFGFGKR